MDRCMAGDLLKETFPETVREIEEFRGETSITVDAGRIRDVMAFLKENEKLCYDLLLDLARQIPPHLILAVGRGQQKGQDRPIERGPNKTMAAGHQQFDPPQTHENNDQIAEPGDLGPGKNDADPAVKNDWYQKEDN